LSCRTVDISAYSRSKGLEAYVPADGDELSRLLALLRARKVFRQTRVLFPTNWGLPAVASITSINDLADLEKRHGVGVKQITYDELAKSMEATLSSQADRDKAAYVADELIKNARKSFLDKKYVVSSLQFYRTITRLMNQHKCNAFTIECFELCSSRLPEKWKITPCLVHTLLKDRGHASSCEADFGGLLSMRLLMSVSQKSSHLGNMFLRPGDVLAINHSASGLRMNGFNQPPLPYKLGRFVQSGWGTKFVVDFMNTDEKRVTVVRIDPTATKMLVLKGKLVGTDGWEGDNLGCSVEARVVPIEGTAEAFARKQTDYGNHLVWTFGHYADELQQLGQMLDMKVEVVG
jgi:L-fucose isomerase-like protein